MSDKGRIYENGVPGASFIVTITARLATGKGSATLLVFQAGTTQTASLELTSADQSRTWKFDESGFIEVNPPTANVVYQIVSVLR